MAIPIQPPGPTEVDAIRAAAFLTRIVNGESEVAAEFADPSVENGYGDDYASFIAAATAGAPGGAWQVLGAEDFPPGSFGADVRYTEGGLYIGGPRNGAEALAVQAEIGGETVLILTFRGSDGVDALLGQTFTAQGAAAYYDDLSPIIEAAALYAGDPANGIDAVIVAGHSLGATMADIFTLTDAELFAGLPLTVVSIASAGVPPSLFPDASGPLTSPEAVTHLGIAHAGDPIRFPEAEPLVFNQVLVDNLHFAPDVVIELPSVDTDVGGDPPFGAEHSSVLYWENLAALTDDPLFEFYEDQTLILGASDYGTVPDYTGTGTLPSGEVIGAEGFSVDDDAPGLLGTEGDDFILGLDGNDRLIGRAGDDLLSGGEGADTLIGGAGDDVLLLRTGDAASGGSGADRFIADAGADSALILGFDPGADVIDLALTGAEEADLVIRSGAFVAHVDYGSGALTLFGAGTSLVSPEDFVFAEPELLV
jgi:hypothetical protein